VSSLAGFDDLRALEVIQIWETVAARAIHGERQSLAVVELDPHAVVPEHSHENEQLGIVIRGSLEFRIEDEKKALGPGETWTIPPNVPHEVVAGPEGAVVVDVFAPVRGDWEGLEKTPSREPLWPPSRP
jgi:quercetin dioxygenase-like cupin family protein